MKSRLSTNESEIQSDFCARLDRIMKWLLIGTLRIFIVLVSMLYCSQQSFASVNIPLDSSFYQDIDILIAHGLIKSGLSSTKPFTRAEAGRLLAEAIDYGETEGISPLASEILDRLTQYYGEEIAEARMPASAPRTYLKPLDEFSITYARLDGPFYVFNNEGIEYFDGGNGVVQFQSSARLWRVFTFFVEPMYTYNQKYGGVERNRETDLKLHKAYLKLSIGNFEIQVGKDSLWWGPGYHGALVISNNARPFNMIKISNPQATLLPWFLRGLGPFRYNVFFSILHESAPLDHPPDSKLFGLRFDFKPRPTVELGVSYLIHFDGDRPGIEDLDFSDYASILFSNTDRCGDKRDNNKQIAIDASLTIPHLSEKTPVTDSIKLYFEWGAEHSGDPPDRRGYIIGTAFKDIFTIRGLQLRGEYARLSPESVPTAWYGHPIWPMRYYGREFGHHLGTNSDDLFFELSHRVNLKCFYKVGFDRERTGLSREHTQEKDQFFVEAGYDFKERSNLTVRYWYEHIDNLDNVQDAEQENHFMGAELTFRF